MSDKIRRSNREAQPQNVFAKDAVVSREEFEDTILFDKIGEYIVNETLVSVQYFRDDKKIGYYNAISGNWETYSGVEVADHILRNLTFSETPY